jgi:hypothetical protein
MRNFPTLFAGIAEKLNQNNVWFNIPVRRTLNYTRFRQTTNI